MSPRRSLAHREPREAAYDDVLARLGREVAAQLLDRLALVLVAVDMDLVEQHDLAEPALELALDDPRADVLGLVGGLLLEHPRLGVADVLGHLVLADPAGLRRGGDVQRDVLGEGDEVGVGGDEVGVAVDLDEHADLAVGVDVALDRALGGLAVGELAELVAHLDAQDLGRVLGVLGVLGSGLGLGLGVGRGPVAFGFDLARRRRDGIGRRIGGRRSGVRDVGLDLLGLRLPGQRCLGIGLRPALGGDGLRLGRLLSGAVGFGLGGGLGRGLGLGLAARLLLGLAARALLGLAADALLLLGPLGGEGQAP